jgi:hypothetical protein
MYKLVALALAAATLPCSAQLRLDLMPEAALVVPQQQTLAVVFKNLYRPIPDAHHFNTCVGGVSFAASLRQARLTGPIHASLLSASHARIEIDGGWERFIPMRAD